MIAWEKIWFFGQIFETQEIMDLLGWILLIREIGNGILREGGDWKWKKGERGEEPVRGRKRVWKKKETGRIEESS